MVFVACGCLTGLMLLYVLRARGDDRGRRDASASAEEGTALDRGLAHLIKDISRTPLHPPPSPRGMTPTGPVTAATRARLARGSDLLPTAPPLVQPRRTGFEVDDDAPTTTLQTFEARQHERR